MNRRLYYLALALVLLGILLRQALLVVFGVLLLLVLGMVDLWAAFCMRDLHYQRQLSQERALFGEEVTLSISVENAKLIPLPWLEVEDVIPRALTLQGQRLRRAIMSNTTVIEALFSPGWYERITRRYTLRCNARGVHTFGPTTLRSGDVFGFINREITLSNYQYLLVYPLVVPLTRFGLPSRHPFGERSSPRRLLEDPLRVIGTRDYVYGDSLRRVDWKATARVMSLQSKVYEPTTTYTLALFLNIPAQLDAYYGARPELQELSICAAASISSWAIDQGYAIALYANTIMSLPDEEQGWAPAQGPFEEQTLAETIAAQLKRRRIHLPASSSEEQRRRILEALARIQGYFGTTIEELIAAERTRLPVGSTIVVITSMMSELLIDTLSRLRLGGHAVSILYVGDSPAPARLAGITIYALGGEEMWQQLSQGQLDFIANF